MQFVPKLTNGDLLAGRYRIERILGQGGMSRVYLAADLKLPGKVWAVKESFTRPGTPTSVAKEAELLISLNHHRLPRIVDFVDTNREGYSYIVMDFIEGVHLDRFVQSNRGRLTQEVLARFGLQITEGLHYLHSHQPPIIHRDVKPSNLLVDGKGEIRFVDFGIARTYADDKSEDTVQLGTVGFASPEQYGGRQSDARSDLYSLGAVLLYLGTGCKHNVWSEEAAAALRKQGNSALFPIVSRLMQVRPEDRYPSAEAVSAALRGVAMQASGRGSLEETTRAAGQFLGGRTAQIAVIGVSAGVGTTHTAIALAHTLARKSKRVAIAEMDTKAAAFQHLANIVEGEPVASAATMPHRFRIGNVVYAKLPTRSEFIELLTEGYDCVICDLGTGRSKEQMEEFRRADLSIVVGSGAEWKAGDLERFADAACGAERIPPGWRFCVPLASAPTMRRLGKMLRTRFIYSLPAEPDPFEPGPAISTVLQEVCGDLLLPSKRVNRGFLIKQKT